MSKLEIDDVEEMVADMIDIAQYPALRELLEYDITGPGTNETFGEISRSGLAALDADPTMGDMMFLPDDE